MGDAVQVPSEAVRVSPTILVPDTVGLEVNVGGLETGPVDALNRAVEPPTLFAVTRATKCLPMSLESRTLVVNEDPVTAMQPSPSEDDADSRILSQRNHW